MRRPALVYPANPLTFWNNILVACAVLVLSLIPGETERTFRGGPRDRFP